ncbi:MAG: ABC transporter ATP-binding protein [Gemmatimonadota bacterium]
MSLSPPVVASGLTFSYGDGPPVLAGVGFRLHEAEVLGIVGANGSGKTTLLRMIAGLLRPQAGTLGVTIPSPAVVFDRLPFQEALTGAENMRTILALRGRKRAADRQVGAGCLSDFGLAKASDQPVSAYSFGMRRRLALAEAFAGEPSLLLLDEPTVGLDPLGRDALADALEQVSDRGGAVLAATNDADFAERCCSRVLLLHQGKVVAEGSPKSLIAELAAPTIIAVEFTGPVSIGSPPGGLATLDVPSARAAADYDPPAAADTVTPRALEFSSRTGTAALADLCAWFAAAGADISSVQVREPGLADVLRSVAGVGLEAGHQAAIDVLGVPGS